MGKNISIMKLLIRNLSEILNANWIGHYIQLYEILFSHVEKKMSKILKLKWCTPIL